MSQPRFKPTLEREITKFCRKRCAPFLPPHELVRLEAYMLGLVAEGRKPALAGKGISWRRVANDLGFDPEWMVANSHVFRPGFEAIRRAAAAGPRHGRRARPKLKASPSAKDQSSELGPTTSTKRIYQRKQPIAVLPEPQGAWDDPATFHDALALHMKRHNETSGDLWRGIVRAGESLERSTIVAWRRGVKAPRGVASMDYLRRIEQRYRLPGGYFSAKLPHPASAATGHCLEGISAAEQRRLAWHLPDDFGARNAAEREEILEWVQRVIISGSTEYRRYQAAAAKLRYAVRFPSLQSRARVQKPRREEETDGVEDPDLAAGTVRAPRILDAEMHDLIHFKTANLTPLGYQRRGAWNDETASQKVEHLGLMFGALAASPRGAIRGHGVPLSSLSFALLAFPAVWDWYVRWREARRGFYTTWEVDMLSVGVALTGPETGWMTQTPHLAERLRPIPGLISQADIERARSDWPGVCAALNAYALARAKEIKRIAKVHRDPFEPILAVLEADSPLAEYRRIADEVVRLMPCGHRYPKSKAEAVRSLLLLRLGLHLGLRQRNLREMLVCPKGRPHTSERHLADRRRGELRWSERDQGWEVFIPSAAFKNHTSSFFGGRPFRLVLPDLGDLYGHIDEWIDKHRPLLLGRARDPATFFVKTVKRSSSDAAYDQNTFYEAWRLTIQRYGIFNPYTGRGAIAGLLPHGPHNVRDVLATHILKKTGSYEQASYAIQDTPDMVAKHYGRFLPQDKAAMAAKILNEVWEAA